MHLWKVLLPSEKKEEAKKLVADAKIVIENMKTAAGVTEHLASVKAKMSALLPQDNGSQDQPPGEAGADYDSNNNIMVRQATGCAGSAMQAVT